MKTVIVDGMREHCLRSFGIDEADAMAVIEHPEQFAAVALNQETDTVALFAGKAKRNDRFVLLIFGRLSGEVFTANMAFKVPPDISGPSGALNPPLQMLKDIVERFGLVVSVGKRFTKFIANERIPVPSIEAVQPVIHNPKNVPYIFSFLTRPLVRADLDATGAPMRSRPRMTGPEIYADCDLCFCIDTFAYKEAIDELSPEQRTKRPEEGSHQVKGVITADAAEIMRTVGLTPDRIETTLREQHRGMVLNTGNNQLFVASHWFDDGQIVFVQGFVSKSHREGMKVWALELTTDLVLALRDELPAGKLDRNQEMKTIFSLVANSFGVPLVCHTQYRPAKLYTGPWNGQVPTVLAPQPEAIRLSGSYNPSVNACTWVWGFSLRLYLEWWNSVLGKRH